jgi:tRNA pseudouridine38-40 synthase
VSARNIKLVLAYDGTDFEGWQIQKTGRTIQGVVQEALARMHGHPISLTAAGRTDSGVHATGQVANFFSDLDSIPDTKFPDAINSYLPWDVRVLESRCVSDSFSARKSASLRVYHYYLNNASVELPHYRRYSYQIRRRLDIKPLNRLAAVFLGEHDYTTFAAAKDKNLSKKRRVSISCFFPDGPFLVYRIASDSFLWRMVRSILGTILEIAARDGDRKELEDVLHSKDRRLAGQTVPARGLFLERVYYQGEETPIG